MNLDTARATAPAGTGEPIDVTHMFPDDDHTVLALPVGDYHAVVRFTPDGPQVSPAVNADGIEPDDDGTIAATIDEWVDAITKKCPRQSGGTREPN